MLRFSEAASSTDPAFAYSFWQATLDSLPDAVAVVAHLELGEALDVVGPDQLPQRHEPEVELDGGLQQRAEPVMAVEHAAAHAQCG